LTASSSSASSSATPSPAAVDKEAKSMSKQEMADDVPMRDASNLSVELDNHRKKINETEQELSEVKIKVKSKLDKLEGKEGAGTLSDIEQKHLERLREDKRQLQTKEAQLQTEKLLLLEKEKELRENEKELRRALTSSTPYSSAASAAVPAPSGLMMCCKLSSRLYPMHSQEFFIGCTSDVPLVFSLLLVWLTRSNVPC